MERLLIKNLKKEKKFETLDWTDNRGINAYYLFTVDADSILSIYGSGQLPRVIASTKYT